jgi:hypothetical protein
MIADKSNAEVVLSRSHQGLEQTPSAGCQGTGAPQMVPAESQVIVLEPVKLTVDPALK